jgi:hypothetical protein
VFLQRHVHPSPQNTDTRCRYPLTIHLPAKAAFNTADAPPISYKPLRCQINRIDAPEHARTRIYFPHLRAVRVYAASTKD